MGAPAFGPVSVSRGLEMTFAINAAGEHHTLWPVGR